MTIGDRSVLELDFSGRWPAQGWRDNSHTRGRYKSFVVSTWIVRPGRRGKWDETIVRWNWR